jgi:hypothetical protein
MSPLSPTGAKIRPFCTPCVLMLDHNTSSAYASWTVRSEPSPQLPLDGFLACGRLPQLRNEAVRLRNENESESKSKSDSESESESESDSKS